MSIQQIVEDGVVLAKKAVQEAESQYGEDKYPCGFAWVEVRVDRTNSKEAKELIAAGFKKSYQSKTLDIWNPGNSRWQNVDVKYAGAVALANHLRANGFRASACERLD